MSAPGADWQSLSVHVHGGDFFEAPRTMWKGPELEPAPYDGAVMLEVFEQARQRALESGA